MGEINLLAVIVATVAFWLVGALWYGVLFGKAWQREAGVTARPAGSRIAVVMGLTLAFEMLVVVTLAHLVARTSPSPHIVLMMAAGFALGIMTPAIGINYLHQNKSLTLFLIDAGHFLAGMLAAAGVFTLFN